MPVQRRGRVIAGCLTLLLSLSACHDGGSGGGPPGAQGAPPGGDGPGAPGAPVAPGGRQGHGGAPGGPYKIPPTVLLKGTVLLNDADTWAAIQQLVWAACPGGSHCVELERAYVAVPGVPPCQFVRVDPAVGTSIEYHKVITVIGGAPCPPGGDGGDSPDASAPPEEPDSPPPDVQAPSSP